VRCEMRTKLFLRTLEFYWQEGHTAHATAAEARAETQQMLNVYTDVAVNEAAIPVIPGEKSAAERFAGAEMTLTIEAMMGDGRALQSATSHFMGQNFAKAFDVKFLNESNKEEYVWATSWGVSTRLVGGLIMTHSDDDGLVLPPKLAPTQVVIVPIPKPAAEIDEVAEQLMKGLRAKGISVQYDEDQKKRPGFKFAEHEMKGTPVRIGIGKRDLEKNQVEIARRDTKEKAYISVDGTVDYVENLLTEIQDNLFNKAKAYRDAHITPADNFEDFQEILEHKGGFIAAHWDGTTETELKIKELTKATIRCIPNDAVEEAGTCILTGKPSTQRVLFAKAY
ncbi:MAG: proline--tRNA ligase, partial [Phaeodactylibacter sp.]|nr:proline--tRNA ligase [Phaeodactylibacter sp.]